MLLQTFLTFRDLFRAVRSIYEYVGRNCEMFYLKKGPLQCSLFHVLQRLQTESLQRENNISQNAWPIFI